MKIKVEFESMDEFRAYMSLEASAPVARQTHQEAQEAPEAPAPRKNTKKAEKPAPAPAAEPEQPAEVKEEFRITVRKQLAALNQKCGRNRASELITELTGKKKLTEVALEDLPKLMKAAKEESDAN